MGVVVDILKEVELDVDVGKKGKETVYPVAKIT